MARLSCGRETALVTLVKSTFQCKEHLDTRVGGEGRCEPDIGGRCDENEIGDDGEQAVNFVHEGRQREKN
jgi:hypothetical protein